MNFYFVKKEQPFIKVIIIEIAHSVKKFQAQPILQYHHLPLLSCRALKQIILLVCWKSFLLLRLYNSLLPFVHRPSIDFNFALCYFTMLYQLLELQIHCRYGRKRKSFSIPSDSSGALFPVSSICTQCHSDHPRDGCMTAMEIQCRQCEIAQSP